MVKVGLWVLMWIWEIIQVFREEWKTKKERIADKREPFSHKKKKKLLHTFSSFIFHLIFIWCIYFNETLQYSSFQVLASCLQVQLLESHLFCQTKRNLIA